MPTQRKFEITYTLKDSSNAAQQKSVIQATDSTTARRIFEQQNPRCKVQSYKEIREDAR